MGAWMVAGAGLLCVAGWWPSAEPHTRPWRTAPTIFGTSRWENYFRYHPLDRPPTEACVQAVVAAKIESLQVLTHYGFPYPLVQRFLAAGAHAKIWGALPAAATTPPDGVVVMEPFDRWLPLYLQLPGAGERFRAVGATDPFGLYVPESRARALAATLALPRFVGWDTAENLGPLEFESRGDRFWRVRRLLAAETRLGFHRDAAQQHVQLEAANLSTAPCELEVRLDGRRVAVVRFEPDATVQTVEVPIAAAGERAELRLVVTEQTRRALRLTAIRIVD